MLILGLLIFLTITSALVGVFLWLSPTRTEQRLQAITSPARESNWTETVVKVAGPLSKLSAPQGADWETSRLRLRFLNAGIRSPEAPLLFYAAKTALPLLFAGLAFLWLRTTTSQSYGITLLFYVMLFALIGVYLPNFVVWMAGRGRKREIFENFPDASDLLLVCMEAGLGLDSALTKVTEEVRRKSQALAEELHLTNLEMRAGATREKALHNLAMRTGVEEISTFSSMLTQADKFGTSIGDSLRVFSDDLRYKRQVRAEELAAKVPTKMLFPLVLFIFPSVIMVVLGPAVIQIIRMVMPMLSGEV
ncbi:type II secretion system F family protein [Ramlibacter solisilvae]|uniref:Type II secretion system protein n=1 Tax=Ramlibacter tataouinensis TaxID=94132 RepID=A0A127JWZ4_9BURK|nr:type II secretion system F family protein [Ramlibacter tataouinensis]AMO24444.1 type II secretion system protein [Ramlibacter tataouinensis]